MCPKKLPRYPHEILKIFSKQCWAHASYQSLLKIKNSPGTLPKPGHVSPWSVGDIEHLAFSRACILPSPKGASCANYAKYVNQILLGLSNMKVPFLIQIYFPITSFFPFLYSFLICFLLSLFLLHQFSIISIEFNVILNKYSGPYSKNKMINVRRIICKLKVK